MTLRLNGDSSGFTEIKAADAAGDNSIKLPASNGSANQLLQNGGTAGELQYTSAGGGLHYDSSGRLLAGTSTSYNNGRPGKIQVASTGDAFITATRFGSTSGGGELYLGASKGSFGTQGLVSNGFQLGLIAFSGSDGTQHREAATIKTQVDGTPGADVMPGKLTFSTNGGGASVTPRVEIGSNGALKLLAGCPGIDFSGIQTNAAGMTSETLDSYEEGTWTPVCDSPDYTFSSASGYYTKTGRNVTIWLDIRLSAANGSGSNGGQIIIDGLPFANNDFYCVGAGRENSSTGSIYVVLILTGGSNTKLVVNPYEGISASAQDPFIINRNYGFCATYFAAS